ncbi:MAG: type II toxin-antitoxin system RatA family toxin [Alphaproteobacteria bacterium]|nr:type II toxin-antitoxin system RatA family toxin [Alphaproteobacteria bacterium]
MPTHAETKSLPYPPQQMFDLVADVERYPEFLPWCCSCRIVSRQENVIMAELVIGYKLVRESFLSKVTLIRPDEIRVEYLRGPLRHLSNSWKFLPEESGGCTIDFFVDFEFRNIFFQRLMGVFFNEIVRRMVSAFEERARSLYKK